ncbi:hypothetical protein BBO_02027 [Beauveria brongniartii RCEF 3172]|uniref:Uncharacterized protein n=1 Tax=Beauveria brongniartii RCEF 3172 TaxID=1081107 RepID=A0A167IEE1_9HYPO|nr:hypothetical protein BBO_02027 [Beauveria brongniartii RCEF 3172]
MLLQAAYPISSGAMPSYQDPFAHYNVASPAMSTGSNSHQQNHYTPSTSSDPSLMPPGQSLAPPSPPPPPVFTLFDVACPPPPPHRSPSPRTIRHLLDTLTHQRIDTMTELCRIERAAAACARPDDARAFQGPMTCAWVRYVVGRRLLVELRGLTPGFPVCAELVDEAHRRVRADPASNRSWNLAWLCLVRIRDDNLVAAYAVVEASKPCMWGGLPPSDEDVFRLSVCFEREWTLAVAILLRHWPVAPAWY